ncbi:tRNA (adenine(37)-N6)-methyltransferase isoform X2 [Anguilla anguilla]|uniref:tRNA (adenine(37)-N6)-methyltransferase isoform X2 n=1 Tax=Anguilla anguilla TaxID=7936 RepID=UPI0015AE8AD8|nr:tRNA (adenine(37)-N6)-methyltransferase isoform X2 [Anguilla anguilla]
MSSTCSCAQHVKKLNQQISVMRKEIKNLRHLIDSAVRSHRKHLDSLLSALSHSEQLGVRLYPKPDQKVQDGEGISLEEGNIQTVPIGYISSCFPGKNGTPRQPGICGQSRATLRIEASVFNNPDHALIGLEHYSHVWVIFLFHKNGRLSCKAKVKPPRLNGQRVGVYSTRSPHRPNALGLTLAKLESITGDTLHLSGIDMIAGTPVLDIKPYIPEYDSPSGRTDFGNNVCPEMEGTTAGSPTGTRGSPAGSPTETRGSPAGSPTETRGSPSVSHSGGCTVLSEEEGRGFGSDVKEESACDPAGHAPLTDTVAAALRDVQRYISQSDVLTGGVGEAGGAGGGVGGAGGESTPLASRSRAEPFEGRHDERHGGTEACYSEAPPSQVASWVRAPPVASLAVRLTPHAEGELRQFQPPGKREPGRPSFRFLRGPEEAEAAIRDVLRADPRSVYRRTRCPDRLFYFVLDSAHITCWFGGDFAEVVRVRPAEPVPAGPEG